MKKRILIADDSQRTIDAFMKSPHASEYELDYARTGPECFEKIESFKPDLVALQLMLPNNHGIEILKKIRSENKPIGVIICSEKSMIQDYHAAIESGANYYLLKPFEPEEFFQIAKEYFEGKLKQAPFSCKATAISTSTKDYYTSANRENNYLKFWGTRGSITVSGSEYTRIGGNTCCLEINYGDDLIIIDAGTGIRPLGFELLKKEKKRIHLFIGHTHWDHIIGFPFFEPLYKNNYEIHIYAPTGFGKSTKELFTEMLAYDFFPVRLDEVQADLHFYDIHDLTPVSIGKVQLDFHYTFHPGLTYCFKITTPKQIIGYATDNELLMGYHDHPCKITPENVLLEPHLKLIEFYEKCDILIHEAQYTPEEYIDKVGWGHSSIANAAVLIRFCKTPWWIVTHHDPSHDDQFLFEILQQHRDIAKDCNINSYINLAYDGLIVPL